MLQIWLYWLSKCVIKNRSAVDRKEFLYINDVTHIKGIRWAVYEARMGRGVVLTGFWRERLKEGPLGIPRRRREDIIKMGLREVG
jgi:hypothetical protein